MLAYHHVKFYVFPGLKVLVSVSEINFWLLTASSKVIFRAVVSPQKWRPYARMYEYHANVVMLFITKSPRSKAGAMSSFHFCKVMRLATSGSIFWLLCALFKGYMHTAKMENASVFLAEKLKIFHVFQIIPRE